jgi:hypothetical protein
MDIADLVIIPGFIAVITLSVITVQKLFGFSFLMACLVGGPAGWLLGMLIIALLGTLPQRKRKVDPAPTADAHARSKSESRPKRAHSH